MATVSGTRPVRVALYARVSTSDQRADLQVDELRRIAEQRGWVIAGEFIDHGVSGAKDRRPRLDAMMKDIHAGRVDLVACWKMDRMARSVRHLINTLDEFRARNVEFYSARDAIDTSTPAGRFSFAVIAAVAELERELIRERTKAGIAAARRRGARLGRPRVDVDAAAVQALHGKGLSVRAIAKQLKLKRSTVHRALGAVPKTPSKTTAREPQK